MTNVPYNIHSYLYLGISIIHTITSAFRNLLYQCDVAHVLSVYDMRMGTWRLFLCRDQNEQGQVKIPTRLEWCFPIVSKRACISLVLTLSCLLIGQLCPSSFFPYMEL